MSSVSMTKMSSKGQVVIPEDIREHLGLSTGTKFVVVGEEDTVILKMVQPPPKKELKSLLAKARTAARKANLKKSNISKVIKKARKKNESSD